MVISEYLDTNMSDTIDSDTIMYYYSRIIWIINIIHPQMVIVVMVIQMVCWSQEEV